MNQKVVAASPPADVTSTLPQKHPDEPEGRFHGFVFNSGVYVHYSTHIQSLNRQTQRVTVKEQQHSCMLNEGETK